MNLVKRVKQKKPKNPSLLDLLQPVSGGYLRPPISSSLCPDAGAARVVRVPPTVPGSRFLKHVLFSLRLRGGLQLRGAAAELPKASGLGSSGPSRGRPTGSAGLPGPRVPASGVGPGPALTGSAATFPGEGRPWGPPPGLARRGSLPAPGVGEAERPPGLGVRARSGAPGGRARSLGGPSPPPVLHQFTTLAENHGCFGMTESRPRRKPSVNRRGLGWGKIRRSRPAGSDRGLSVS